MVFWGEQGLGSNRLDYYQKHWMVLLFGMGEKRFTTYTCRGVVPGTVYIPSAKSVLYEDRET